MKKVLAVLCLSILGILAAGLIPWGIERSVNMEITTRSAAARAEFLAGRDFYEHFRFEEAECALKQAIQHDSRFALAYLYLSRVQSTGRESRNSLSRAISLAERVSDGERLLILADRAAAYQNPAEQLQLLTELVDLHPAGPRAQRELGFYHFGQREWLKAAAAYSKVTELAPDFAEPYNNLGYCYQFLGDLAAAEECFLAYMKLSPDDPNPYDSYADLLTDMNRHQEAIQFYEMALEVQSDYLSSHLGIAHVLSVLGRYDEARAGLVRLYQTGQDDNQRRLALQGLTLSYLDEGDFEGAIQQLEVGHQIAEASGDTTAMARDLDAMGLIWLEIGRPEEASKAFTSALNLMVVSADYPSAAEFAQLDHNQRMGMVWLRRGDFEQARELVKKYQAEVSRLQDRSRIQLAHQTLGLIALESRNLPRAIDELNQCDLDQAYNQYFLALAHEKANDLPEALRWYSKASTNDRLNRFGQALVRLKALRRVESLRLAHEPQSTSPTN